MTTPSSATPAVANANGNANGNGNGNGKRRGILLAVTLVIVLLAIGWWVLWKLVLSRRETTDDGYVAGNLVAITTQTSGTVIAVLADDTQRVEVGQPLVRLDPTDSQVALSQAAAALSQAVRQIHQQTDTATQFDALISSHELELSSAEADVARRQPLVASRAVAPEELRHAETAVAVARAALLSARRQASAAHAVVDGTDVANQPAVLQAKAAYEQAWVDAQRTTIAAPVSGYIAQRSIQVGQRIAPGQMLMTVIPLGNLWVNANFKESQLGSLRLGQKAEIRSEVYGNDVVFHGRVSGLAAGTGSAFALLPAQNASGNWIKVVQRLPVRIDLDPAELQQHPLRIGLSTDVEVDTVDRSGPMIPIAGATKMVGDTGIYADLQAQATHQADAIIAAALAHSR